MLAKQSYRKTSRRLSTRIHETVQNMENAVYRVQRCEVAVDRNGRGAAGPRKKQRLKREEECLVRVCICFSLREMVKASDTSDVVFLLETGTEEC